MLYNTKFLSAEDLQYQHDFINAGAWSAWDVIPEEPDQHEVI